MATSAPANTGNLMVNIFNGRRLAIDPTQKVLIRIFDGNQELRSGNFHSGPNIGFRDLPFFDNLGDYYTVIASANDHADAGFTPVKLLRNAWQHIDLMLLPKDGSFNFRDAEWGILRDFHPKVFELLSSDALSETAAKDRYADLMENRGATLAAFLNITTAMSTVWLPTGTPLD